MGDSPSRYTELRVLKISWLVPGRAVVFGLMYERLCVPRGLGPNKAFLDFLFQKSALIILIIYNVGTTFVFSSIFMKLINKYIQIQKSLNCLTSITLFGKVLKVNLKFIKFP